MYVYFRFSNVNPHFDHEDMFVYLGSKLLFNLEASVAQIFLGAYQKF